MDARPFRVLGVQQIAIGALDKQPLLELWSGLLGLPVRGQFESVSENVSEAILELGAGAARVELDLMQPLDPAQRPKVHEPTLNHVGLWVDDLPAAYAWLRAQGVRFAPGGIRKGASGHDVCFVHPKPSEDAPRS
ncbi:MAG TPA: VOC family protein, partial [Polyangiaceae bacterium]|nr:VOC family protein [Polyangiaceae bacterium]